MRELSFLLQLKLYHEDFERERHAREAAIKVKNLAEERMKKMERDMKELRDRLNVQAARRLREDQVTAATSCMLVLHIMTTISKCAAV